MMVTRPVNKEQFVDTLHNFVRSHNAELGMQHGLPQNQIEAIMEDQKQANRVLCGHIYDFLVLEGYIER